MTKNFSASVMDRRSYYGISKETVVADDRIKEIVENGMKYTPSAQMPFGKPIEEPDEKEYNFSKEQIMIYK